MATPKFTNDRFKIIEDLCRYADSAVGMLHSGGYPGAAAQLAAKVIAVKTTLDQVKADRLNSNNTARRAK